MTIQQYWRAAGFSYLRYANMCAAHVRSALKDQYRTPAVKSREDATFDAINWVAGKEASRGLLCACYIVINEFVCSDKQYAANYISIHNK